MSSPNDLLLLFGQVSSEACDAFGEYPNAPVRDFDMRENVCGRKLVYVAGLVCLSYLSPLTFGSEYLFTLKLFGPRV